jgi:CRISPR-associated protein Cas1
VKWKRFQGDHGVLVLSGYGLRIAIARGHLILEDGLADRRRVWRLSRIDRDVKRIAIIGHAGTISLDAIRWLHDVKIPLIHLDTDGRVLAMVTPDSPDHPILRRAQAQAADAPIGLDIARGLLRQKFDGQERVLKGFTAGQLALPHMELARRALPTATAFPALRVIEARAAVAYWGAWNRMPVHFRDADADRIPAHWQTFGPRASVLSGSPRLAVNPANAILNYLYAILEAEARIALLAVGCDPGVGIQHADFSSRDSMACDVMEAVRPDVDEWLRALLSTRTLRRQHFFEHRTGHSRLMPDLAKELAQTASLWAGKLGPVVEGVAQALYSEATAPERPRRWIESTRQRVAGNPLPTRLTESRRKASVRRSPLPVKEPTEDEGSSGPLVGPPVRITRQQFLKEIMPELRSIPPDVLAEAIGLSVAYCARIRIGSTVPNHRHWRALAEAARRSAQLQLAQSPR